MVRLKIIPFSQLKYYCPDILQIQKPWELEKLNNLVKDHSTGTRISSHLCVLLWFKLKATGAQATVE